jgi:hypothetical protein
VADTRTAEILDVTGDTGRSAHASFRGYVFQAVWTARQWLTLGPDEVLVVEGQEDADRLVRSGDGWDAHLSQLKDLSEDVNIRDEEVRDSVFNFIRAYHRHTQEQRNCRLLFLTTAGRKKQNKGGTSALDVDVLKVWLGLGQQVGDERTQNLNQLKAALRALAPSAGPNATEAERARVAAIAAALGWLDAEDPRWEDFFVKVEWAFDQPRLEEQWALLEAELIERQDGPLTPNLAQCLVCKVLGAAVQPEVDKRCLDRDGLDTILRMNQQDMEAAVEQRYKDYITSTRRAIDAVNAASRGRMHAARLLTAGISLERRSERERVAAHLGEVVVLFGASGTGKSALLRGHAEATLAAGGLVVWLDAAALQRWPDLAALSEAFRIREPLLEVIKHHQGERLLVLDGLDQAHEQELEAVGALLAAFGVGGAAPVCKVAITCQPQEWPRVEKRLRAIGVATDAWARTNLSPPTVEELTPIWAEIPAAEALFGNKPLVRHLNGNLKMLDLVWQAGRKGEVDVAPLIGETSVATLVWNQLICEGERAEQRGGLVMKVARVQADSLRATIPLGEEDRGQPLDELKKARICLVRDDRLGFEHDLFGDWVRLRILISWSEDLDQHLTDRLGSPVWQRAIRLYGVYLLDDQADLAAWRATFRTLDHHGRAGADPLLEAIALSARADEHLESLRPDLLANQGALLIRLLERFTSSSGTQPDPRYFEPGRAKGWSEVKVAALYRYPNFPYWHALMPFLHRHRAEVVAVAAEQVVEIVRLWLDFTEAGDPWRKEAAELALTLARRLLRERMTYRGNRKTVFRIALAAVEVCEGEIVAFALNACERSTEQMVYRDPAPYRGRAWPQPDPDAPWPAPWPDGPRNRVDSDFREAVLKGEALVPLMARQPTVAREVILACLIAHRSPNERDAQYREWSGELVESAVWLRADTTSRNPFLDLLGAHFEHGLEVVLRVVDFAARRWSERRSNAERKEPSNDLVFEVNGATRIFLGDERIFGWSAGLGSPAPDEVLTFALVALERHLLDLLRQGGSCENEVATILARAGSVPVLHVLIDVGRKRPHLFEGPLLDLLGLPQLYRWEEAPVFQAAFRRDPQDHHRINLRRLAFVLFCQSDIIRRYLEPKAAVWASEAAGEHFLEWLGLAMCSANLQTILIEGREAIVNAPLRAYEARKQAEFEATRAQEGSDVFNLPFEYRKRIDERRGLPKEQLHGFFEELRNRQTKVKSQDDFSAFMGGVAVLVCLHVDWLDEDVDRRAWCRAIVVGLAAQMSLNEQLDAPEIPLPWAWDSFAADVAAALWEQDPTDPKLREAVATLVVHTPNHQGVTRLLDHCRRSQVIPYADLQSLRRLMFEVAYARYRRNVLNSRVEDEARSFSAGWSQWTRRRINDFVGRALPAPAPTWSEMDDSGLLAHREEQRRAWFGDRLLEFSLVRAAHEAALSAFTESSPAERRYLVEFTKNALGYCMGRPGEHARSVSRPTDDDSWVLGQAGRLFGYMTPEEGPEQIWQALLNGSHGDADEARTAERFSAEFLEAFYRQNLVAPSPRFVELALDFVTTAMVPSRRFKDTATWLAVFGVAVKGWAARHENLALQLWPHIVAWLGEGPAPARFVGALARWLRTEAAGGLRLSALATLRAAIIGRDDQWDRYDRQRAEDEMAELLTQIWEASRTALQADREAFSAFRDLLKWLQDRVNPQGMALAERVGAL